MVVLCHSSAYRWRASESGQLMALLRHWFGLSKLIWFVGGCRSTGCCPLGWWKKVSLADCLCSLINLVRLRHPSSQSYQLGAVCSALRCARSLATPLLNLLAVKMLMLTLILLRGLEYLDRFSVALIGGLGDARQLDLRPFHVLLLLINQSHLIRQLLLKRGVTLVTVKTSLFIWLVRLDDWPCPVFDLFGYSCLFTLSLG